MLAAILNRRLGEIANDGVDIMPNVADLGKFSRFNFDKRRIGETISDGVMEDMQNFPGSLVKLFECFNQMILIGVDA